MSDSIRKTVIEKPKSEGIRTTIIEGETDAQPAAANPRHTVVEKPSNVVSDGRRATMVEKVPAAVGSQLTPTSPPLVFRSLVRPPMAILTALDDGSTEVGETWRIRRSRTSIGRVDCDVEIPQDPDLSATHAEIVRREQDGGHQWLLSDLNSTNGTFVRVNRMVLRNGRELLLGGHRFVFRSPDTLSAGSAADSEESRATAKQAALPQRSLLSLGARLVEQNSDGSGIEHSLEGKRVLIGRDPARCQICLEDPFVNDVHALVQQDKQKRWVLRDQDSLNGIWIKVPNKALDPGTEFLLGGQRFRFDLL